MGIPMPQDEAMALLAICPFLTVSRARDGWRLMLWTELGKLEVGAWETKLLRGA